MLVFSLQVVPFVLQLIETISDISKLLDGSVHDRVDALKQYYDALDQCGKLMAIVLSSDAKVSLSCEIASRLLREIVALLNPAHPRLFRISFARVVPTVLRFCFHTMLTIRCTDCPILFMLGVSRFFAACQETTPRIPS
jgi:hypothetical protein